MRRPRRPPRGEFTGVIRTLEGVHGFIPFTPDLTAIGIHAGVGISGHFELDTSTPDVATSAMQGRYLGAVLSGQFSAAGLVISFADAEVNVTLDLLSLGERISIFSFLTINTSNNLGLLDGLVGFELVDDGGGGIPSDALPSAPPDLDALAPFNGVDRVPFTTSIAFTTADQMGLIRAEFTSLRAVPEPSTLLLFGLGLLTPILASRRR